MKILSNILLAMLSLIDVAAYGQQTKTTMNTPKKVLIVVTSFDEVKSVGKKSAFGWKNFLPRIIYLQVKV
ncbi:hypothetical protein ACVW0P_000228 [Mucilaginibacter sp. UYNi724]